MQGTAIARIPAPGRAYAVSASAIIGQMENFLPAIFLLMWKRHLTGRLRIS
jgi:hypothetical protein